MTTSFPRPLIPPHLRWLIKSDMARVLDIDAASFPVPWCEEELRLSLSKRNSIGLVATHAGGSIICGYVNYLVHSGSLEILRLAVAPEYRRIGVGGAMTNKLKAKLSSKSRIGISVAVPDFNLPAQLFFRSQEFRATRINHARLACESDEYVMTYNLLDPSGNALSAFGRHHQHTKE